jgi:hypothetical protein
LVADSSIILSLPESSRISFGEITTDYQISGDRNGTIEIDRASGRPLDSRSEFSFSGTMTVTSKLYDTPQTWPIEAQGSTRIRYARR